MELAKIQPGISAQFRRILQQGRLSHAYLFTGGFGSFELAIWLSQAIFCEQPQEGLPCETCRACRLVAEQEFSDLHIIRPDGQTIKTAQIRELAEVFSRSGFEGNQKVIIICEAEKMHPNAANSLLKSIEEPDVNTHVFLLTENENLILPTIKSRTQVVQFPKNSAYLADFLEKNGLLKTQANLAAQLCDSTEQALQLAQASWFSESLNKLEQFIKLLKTDQTEAFLYLSNLTEIFDDKTKQNMAFELLLILFNQEKMLEQLQQTFQAAKMWQSNVRFSSCLAFIVLAA